jgi:hypothetical protein
MRSQPSTTPSQATHKRPERGTDAALARRRAVIASVDTDSATAVGGVTNRDDFLPTAKTPARPPHPRGPTSLWTVVRQ